MFRKKCDAGDGAGIGSPVCLWLMVYGFDYRGFFRGEGPPRRVSSYDCVIVFFVDCDDVAVLTIVGLDEVAG